MAKIPETYTVGSREDLTLEKLLDIITDIYEELAIQINKKPDIYERNTDGGISDTRLNVGDLNINKVTGNVQMLIRHDSSTTVTWKTL